MDEDLTQESVCAHIHFIVGNPTLDLSFRSPSYLQGEGITVEEGKRWHGIPGKRRLFVSAGKA